MEVLGLASLIALAWKVVDLLKFLKAGDSNAAVTQIAVWAAGVGAVFLGAEADVFSGLDVAGFVLGDINTASKVLIGMSLLSLGSVGYDFKKAVDSSDSAKTPALTE